MSRRLPAVAVLLLTGTACGGYSAGAMGEMEQMPHTHAHAPGMTGRSHVHAVTGDGLSASLHGYTLSDVRLRDDPAGVSFRVVAPDGSPQLQYTMNHTKLLHLYVMGRDLSTYLHVHPRLSADGTWSAALPAVPSGPVHVVTEFVARDATGQEHALMLGTDVPAFTTAPAAPAGSESRTATVDGYVVTVRGTASSGRPSRLTLTVLDRRGRPAQLEPYLDSWAHVSAVHVDSLALAHLHPDQAWTPEARAPRQLTLTATLPRPGRHLVVVEFAAGGLAHQARLAVTATG